jgi:hypothetical protein
MRYVRLPQNFLLLVPQSPLPKSHGQARTRWLEQRATELLPVEYFHVVFTVRKPESQMRNQSQDESVYVSRPWPRCDCAGDQLPLGRRGAALRRLSARDEDWY